MKNIAKCKLCSSIIESFHTTDYVECKCGEISVSGGAALQCGSKDWNNFRRIDDMGNEIAVKVTETSDVKPLDIQTKPNRKELLEMLNEMIKSYDRLPDHAMHAPITHYDFVSALLLVSSIFKAGVDGSDRNDLS
jgi:hypothetical protein